MHFVFHVEWLLSGYEDVFLFILWLFVSSNIDNARLKVKLPQMIL